MICFIKSTSAARSSAAASFADFLLAAADFAPFFLAAGGDAAPLVSDAFASLAGAGDAGVFFLSGVPSAFAAAGDAAAAGGVGAGGRGNDADSATAAAAGDSFFFAGGGTADIAAAVAPAAVGAFPLAEAAGACAVFLPSFPGAAAAAFAAADDDATDVPGVGAAAAGGDLAEEEEPTVEAEPGDGGGEASPPLPDAGNSFAGGPVVVVAAEAACESSRASLTRFWDCWYRYRGPSTVFATLGRQKIVRVGEGEVNSSGRCILQTMAPCSTCRLLEPLRRSTPPSHDLPRTAAPQSMRRDAPLVVVHY